MTTLRATYEPGDRVIVTDLRTGKIHGGTFRYFAPGANGESPRCVVEYDDGALVRVGRSYVAKAKP